MFRNTVIALSASAAMVIAGPASAQGKGGGHGGGQGAPAASQAPTNAGPPAGGMGETMREQARESSRGPENASEAGRTNANENSVLSTRTQAETGTTVRAGPNAGMKIGGRKNKSDDADLKASSKSKALENSQGPANASPTGIAHANENSVLARGAVAASTLTGLTTGLNVQTSTGATLGTVSQIITGPNDTIRAVVVTSASGQTYTLSPTTLTISGGVVTTTQTNLGG